jgi:hypothetical protein
MIEEFVKFVPRLRVFDHGNVRGGRTIAERFRSLPKWSAAASSVCRNGFAQLCETLRFLT